MATGIFLVGQFYQLGRRRRMASFIEARPNNTSASAGGTGVGLITTG